MKLRYLLDTNIVSRLARRTPTPSVVAHLAENESRCAISAITVEELLYGALTAPDDRRESLLDFVELIQRRFPVLPYDADAARWVARHRAELKRARRTVEHADLCVAAVAASHGMTVITNNRRHFDLFEGLTVVDWTATEAGAPSA